MVSGGQRTGVVASCVMPTANRPAFVPRAIALFLAQTEPDCELIVYDQSDVPVADLVPAHPRIVYRWEPRRILGEAQNRCCELASGTTIIHWDDDDWQGPTRVATQLAALDRARADIAGLARIPFLADDAGAAWDYAWEAPVPWVYGATFAYRRDLWLRQRFEPVQIGHDNLFVLAPTGARVLAMADDGWFVARVHAGNTSPKRTGGPYYYPRDPAPLRARVGATDGRW